MYRLGQAQMIHQCIIWDRHKWYINVLFGTGYVLLNVLIFVRFKFERPTIKEGDKQCKELLVKKMI